MGRFSVEVTLTNYDDMVAVRSSLQIELANNVDMTRAEAGDLPKDRVRRVSVRGVVDTGAARLVLPQAVADQLGLPSAGTAMVRYANGDAQEKPMVHAVHLTYAGRSSVFNAIVEPNRESALIGAIVMEDLDLIADCVTQTLLPRDPHQIISEIEAQG